MFGSMAGNLMGILYFLLFQFMGIIIASLFLKKEKWGFTLLAGSVLGSFSLQWMPVLFAFFLGFSKTAHILALAAMALVTAFLWLKVSDCDWRSGRSFHISCKQWILNDPIILLLIPVFLFTAVMLTGHTLSAGEGLSLHSGQSTYGDMNMHLGFITSIAKQQIFPPEYSILPGTKLAYPFLSDSISSSLYLFGTSLRVAYLVPMYAALAQVFFGMYAVAKTIYTNLGLSYRGKSILAFALFFFNGGLGFYYFINQGFNSENFRRIFTAFYETPTNYVQANVQWHNVICDMLIPQRATLFGWAILFPVLALILKGRRQHDKTYWILSAILSGGLVLIHTHSFLALGVCCAVFVAQDLASLAGEKAPSLSLLWRAVLVCGVLLFLQFVSVRQLSEEPFSGSMLLTFGYMILLCFFAILGVLTYNSQDVWKKDKSVWLRWGFFLAIVLLLALPQLFGFTFRQAQGEQFVRGGFNWANSNPEVQDTYFIFYLKNLGIMFLLPILLLIFGKKEQRHMAMPGVLLWLLCEFVLFQPNSYDNNKLLLVAYLFFCIATADFVWDTLPQHFARLGRFVRPAAVTVTAVLGVFAAILTMGREWVSDYELYDNGYVKACQWVEKNTQPTDTFLTATNHNNAIASLTGRNIVCGSSSFLYYHGVDYTGNEAAVKSMYEDPDARDSLLDEYGVNYIVIGPWELGSYQISDYDTLAGSYEIVYSQDNIVILAVNDR